MPVRISDVLRKVRKSGQVLDDREKACLFDYLSTGDRPRNPTDFGESDLEEEDAIHDMRGSYRIKVY